MCLLKIIVLTLLLKFIKHIYVIIPILEEYHRIINNDSVHSLNIPIRLFMSDKNSDNIHFSNMYMLWICSTLKRNFYSKYLLSLMHK